MEPIDIFVYIFYSFGMIEHFESKMFPFSHTHTYTQTTIYRKQGSNHFHERKEREILV